MQTKTKLMIGLGTVLSVIAMLVIMGMNSASAFYMTVDEVSAQKAEAMDKPLKMSGKIIGDSIQWDSNTIVLTFELEGENGNRIPVVYKGIKPDTLNDGWEAIVEGRLSPEGDFIASDLLVKCPSKYEALEQSGQQPPADHPADPGRSN